MGRYNHISTLQYVVDIHISQRPTRIQAAEKDKVHKSFFLTLCSTLSFPSLVPLAQKSTDSI